MQMYFLFQKQYTYRYFLLSSGYLMGLHQLQGYIASNEIIESPRGLRDEPSSPSGTLDSWVRIPLKAWLSVYICSVFMLFCV
jgi:hypothetical protein